MKVRPGCCELCGRLLEMHKPGDRDLEWEGRARMALARRAAGLELEPLDVEAIRRFPSPRFVGGS